MENKKKSKLEIKKEKLDVVYNHIGELNDEIRIKTRQLKEEKDSKTLTKILKSRQFNHSISLLNDEKLRPSDRSNDIRIYSRMDLDVWKYDDVREWFNKYSLNNNIQEEIVIPSQTGYMIRK